MSTALSPLAHNGMAALRSGGISALPFKSALPAAVAQNRALAVSAFCPFLQNRLILIFLCQFKGKQYGLLIRGKDKVYFHNAIHFKIKKMLNGIVLCVER